MLLLNIERAIIDPERTPLNTDEIEAILEVAWLAILADQEVNDEEMEAFAEAMLRLYGDTLTEEMLHETLERIQRFSVSMSVKEGLDRLATRLSRPAARDQAYRLARVMALSDLETGDEEFLFDQALRRVLGLSDEQAESLADQVIAVLDRD